MMSEGFADRPILAARCGGAEGFAMIIVMGSMAVLFMLGLSLNAVLHKDISQATVFKGEVQAELATRSAVEKALAILRSYEATPAAPLSRLISSPADFKDIKVGSAIAEISYTSFEGHKIFGLNDEEGKINVNKASEELLAKTVIAVIAQFAKKNGSKAAQEQVADLAPLASALANDIVKQRDQKKFILLEELLFLKRVSKSLFSGGNGRAGLRDLLTVWGDGKVNINTAPGEVLSALPGISKKVAASIIELRKGPDGKLGTQDDGIRGIGALFGPGMVEERYRAKLADLIKLRSDFMSARVNAKVWSGQIVITSKSAIAVINSSSKPPRIVYWKEF